MANLLSGYGPDELVIYDAMLMTLTDPIILNPGGDPEKLEELEQLEDREKFGENVYERSEE